jgi:hypothetical protein
MRAKDTQAAARFNTQIGKIHVRQDRFDGKFRLLKIRLARLPAMHKCQDLGTTGWSCWPGAGVGCRSPERASACF